MSDEVMKVRGRCPYCFQLLEVVFSPEDRNIPQIPGHHEPNGIPGKHCYGSYAIVNTLYQPEVLDRYPSSSEAPHTRPNPSPAGPT